MVGATVSPPTVEAQGDVSGARRLCRGVRVQDRSAGCKDSLAGKLQGRRALKSKGWETNVLAAPGAPKFFSKAARRNDF